MALDLAGRHPTRIQRQDLVVEPGEAPLVGSHDLWREGAVSVARNLDLRLPEIALQLLAAGAVAGLPLQCPAVSCFSYPRWWVSSASIARSTSALVSCFSS